MSNVKVSSVVDEAAWRELKALADESRRNISSLLTEAIEGYVRQHRMRPVVSQHLSDSIAENEALGKLLAQ